MSLFDSKIYRDLMYDEEVGVLFSDEAEISALIRVEAALAKVQGEQGLIPEQSAQAIQAGLDKNNIEPTILAASTKRDGVPIPGLIKALRTGMNSPEHAQYLHWGATSQDIMDTALMMRLSSVCEILEQRLSLLLQSLAGHAENYAELPMAARTRAQIATPTSFGAIITSWGSPLLNHLEAMSQLKPRLLQISLSGASGNSSVMGDKASAVRTALADELALGDSLFCWHSDRSSLAEFSSLLTRISGSLAKMAVDCMLATQTEVNELELKGGGSSTMPQKNNPVVAETLQSLFHFITALDGLMAQSLLHRQQRDGAAWAQEWLALPQICLATAKSLSLALELIHDLQPNSEAMASRFTKAYDLTYAEVISFKLAENMPRGEAQAQVKRLCTQAIKQRCSLLGLMEKTYPEIDWSLTCTPELQLGDAPERARAFAARVSILLNS